MPSSRLSIVFTSARCGTFMQHQLVRRQKACGQDGEYCVFGSGDPDRSGEAIAADNPELFHRKKFDQLKNKKTETALIAWGSFRKS